MINHRYITDYLKINAKKLGSKKALICDDRTLDWSEVFSESRIISSFLLQRLDNSQRDQVIAIFLPNGWQFVVGYYGIMSTSNIPMPIDISYKKLEIDNIINQIKPTLIITDKEHLNIFAENNNAVMIEDILDKAHVEHPKEVKFLPPDEQIATLFFASGTTGKPKAIPNTHRNQLWDIEAISGLMDWSENDSILLSLPITHRHGLVIGLLGSLYHGNTVYLHQRFAPEKVLTTLSSGKISIFLGVPAIYKKLIEHNPKGKYNLSKVRLCETGSSYMPKQVWQTFKDRFGVEIFDRYGTSETGTITLNSSSFRAPSIFNKLPDGVLVRTEDNGELSIKSPGLFPGYYKNKALTKSNFTPDGWWRTGDVFVKKGDLLVLKSRIQEKIIKNGYYISPRDIEWALSKNERIAESYVLGLQKETELNDLIAYFIVGNITRKEVIEYSKEQLPSFWRPDIILSVDSLPKTSTGKPIISKLKELVEL